MLEALSVRFDQASTASGKNDYRSPLSQVNKALLMTKHNYLAEQVPETVLFLVRLT